MPPPTQGCCAHDHDCEAAECGPAYSLYKHIDLPHVRPPPRRAAVCSPLPTPRAHPAPAPHQVTCLNEDVDGSCRNVFKPWAQRTSPTEAPLRSNEDDPELLIHIPLDGAMRLKAVCIVGGPGGTAPSKLRV
jgi:hypothetical protein